MVAPHVDESPLRDEPPVDLARRLSLAKARAVSHALDGPHTDAVIIGSDQVADLEGSALGKPGTHARAADQLRAMRGKRICFHTAVAVLRPATGFEDCAVVTVSVSFRQLTDAEIEFYLHAERPYDCAGSAKSEALGIALVDAIESDDPTALVGLPMIRTCSMLRAAGLDVLARPQS